MSDARASERALVALLAREQRAQDAAAEALQRAVAARDGANAARDRAEHAVNAAHEQLAAAATREAAKLAAGSGALSVAWLAEAQGYRVALREALAARRRDVEAARSEALRSDQAVREARECLGAAMGRHRAVEQRIEALRRERARRAEARVEEEAADRPRSAG